MGRVLSVCMGLVLAVVATGAAGCGQERDAADDARRSIVATTGMIGDVARQVGGERVHVSVLMGPGVDPHLFNPTRGDVLALQDADVVLYNGLLLEGRMVDTLASLQQAPRAGRITADAAVEGNDLHATIELDRPLHVEDLRVEPRGASLRITARLVRPVHAVAERVDPQRRLAPTEYEGAYDPHLWMDVAAWAETVDVVADVLADLDPDHESEFRANAEAYRAELEELDDYVRQVIASIPDDQRVLVTAHDAFNYFGRAYDIEVRGVYGMSTESEAGVRELNRLVDYVIDRSVPAAFAESTVDDRAVLSLLAGATRRGHAMVLGGELFSDAMGPRDAYEGTYVGMIDHNATTIALALGGEAPEGGFRGRLTMIEPPVPAEEVEGVEEAGEVFE